MCQDYDKNDDGLRFNKCTMCSAEINVPGEDNPIEHLYPSMHGYFFFRQTCHIPDCKTTSADGKKCLECHWFDYFSDAHEPHLTNWTPPDSLPDPKYGENGEPTHILFGVNAINDLYYPINIFLNPFDG